MLLHDHLALDAAQTRRTADGYLVTRARAARDGIYQYLGAEVDPEGKRFKASDTVKVYRPADEVFAKDSVASFLAKPVTNDHPSQPVTADNWSRYAKGAVMAARKDVLSDGEYLAFDLTIMDSAAIADIQRGKRELSNGYACDLDWTAGVTADGQAYDAVQRNIRGNHVAIVDRGRAGSECRIGDGLPQLMSDGVKEAASWLKKAIALHKKHMDGSAPTTGAAGEKSQMLMMEQMENALAALVATTSKSRPSMKMDRTGSQCRISDSKPFAACDANPAILADLNKEKVMKKIVLDGLQVDLSDADAVAAAFTKLQDQAKAAADEAEDMKKKMAAKDGEVAALTKQLADAKAASEPAAIDKLVADRAALVATVKALDASIVTDGKTDAEIRRALVEAKLGDDGKALEDAAIPGAFAVLARDAKAEQTTKVVHIDARANVVDDDREAKAFADSVANLNAWRQAKA